MRGWPLISVCILSYNRLSYLQKTIQSFFATCTYPELEYIVVDNNSDREVVDYIKSLDFIDKKILNKENMGIGHAMNQARRLARGKYFFNLENDWYFFYRSDWMERAILLFEKDEKGEYVNKKPPHLSLGLVKFKLGAGIKNYTNNPSLMSRKSFKEVGEFPQYQREYSYVSEDVHRVEPHYIKRFNEKFACALSETPCALHIGGKTTNPNYGNKRRRSFEELDVLLKEDWKNGKWLFTYQYMKLRNSLRIRKALRRYRHMEKLREKDT
ncbi:MAG: hypothetical protein AMS17_16405 [Spirochaetes bacterium DG_61]|nr:MAG: hypothetical protein AMS17_16405 [Spirochaetes bacterium DG_61]